jgi:hypothetical protein
MASTRVSVRFTTFNAKDQLVTKEKSFATQEKLEAFLDNEDNEIVQVLAFGD